MLKLALAPKALRGIETLDPRQHRQVVGKAFRLLVNPYPQDSFPLTKVPFHCVDIGEYRIIYRVDGDTLKIPLIGKRNDGEIYRDLRRLG